MAKASQKRRRGPAGRMQTTTRSGAQRLKIADRRRLSQALRRIINRLGKGRSVLSVAGEYGVSQPQLAKLLNERRQGLTTATFNELLWLSACASADTAELRGHIRSLHPIFLFDAVLAAHGTDWLDSQEAFDIRRSVLTPETDEALRAYGREIDRLNDETPGGLGLTLKERDRLGRLRKTHGRLGRVVERFFKTINRRNHDDARWMAAFVRTLAPLNLYFTTGGVERGFHELDDDELAKFVAMGLERELILLKRDHASARAQANVAVQDQIEQARDAHTFRHPAQSFPAPWP